MIDYDKLKQTMNHLEIETLKQIISFVNDSTFWDLRIRHNGEFKTFQVDFLKHFFRELNMDKLTKPEPKFKIGDLVYYRDDQLLYSFKIDEVIYDCGSYYYIHYHDDGGFTSHDGSFDQYAEYVLYPTKESLIQAQIDYWTNLLPKNDIPQHGANGQILVTGNPYMDKMDFDECQHESDGYYYSVGQNMIIRTQHLEGPVTFDNAQYKCKKCGDFYR